MKGIITEFLSQPIALSSISVYSGSTWYAVTLEAHSSLLDILRFKMNSFQSFHGKNCLLKHVLDRHQFLRHNATSGLKAGPFLRMRKGWKAVYLILHLSKFSPQINLVQFSPNRCHCLRTLGGPGRGSGGDTSRGFSQPWGCPWRVGAELQVNAGICPLHIFLYDQSCCNRIYLEGRC